MRKFLSAFVLLLVLCCPAFAGDMLTPPIVTPQPCTTSGAPATNDETSDTATETRTAEDDSTTVGISATRVALSIFESLLAIL